MSKTYATRVRSFQRRLALVSAYAHVLHACKKHTDKETFEKIKNEAQTTEVDA